MKKILIPVLIFPIIIITITCTRRPSPTAPAATNTPIIITATNTPLATTTMTPTITRTITITVTATNMGTFTVTQTSSTTQTTTMTATITATFTTTMTTTNTSTFTQTSTMTQTTTITSIIKVTITITLSPELTPCVTKTVVPSSYGLLIDNCDGGTNVNALGGAWFTMNDCNYGGDSIVWPVPAAMNGTFTMDSPGVDGAGYAAHMTGTVNPYNNATGFGYQYGFIAMGTASNSLALTSCQATDWSIYTGIQFYTKIGPNDNGQYPYNVIIPYTANGASAIVCPTPGILYLYGSTTSGEENPPVCTDNANACQCATLDNYAFADYECQFQPATTWTLEQIPFSAFTVPAWAIADNATTPSTITPVLQNAKQIVWQTTYLPGAGSSYNCDLWIDEIILYK